MECYCGCMADETYGLRLARSLVGWWDKLSDDPGTQLSAEAAHDLASVVIVAQHMVDAADGKQPGRPLIEVLEPQLEAEDRAEQALQLLECREA